MDLTQRRNAAVYRVVFGLYFEGSVRELVLCGVSVNTYGNRAQGSAVYCGIGAFERYSADLYI